MRGTRNKTKCILRSWRVLGFRIPTLRTECRRPRRSALSRPSRRSLRSTALPAVTPEITPDSRGAPQLGSPLVGSWRVTLKYKPMPCLQAQLNTYFGRRHASDQRKPPPVDAPVREGLGATLRAVMAGRIRPSSVTTSYRLMLLLKKSGFRAWTITCKPVQPLS